MTPVEVAFMETEIDSVTGMWFFAWNCVINISFLGDIVKSFFTMFVNENGSLVADARKIKRQYLQGWFAIDVVSILPFDALGIALNDPKFSELKIVRVIRLLRLLKLLRLARGLQMIERWQNEFSVDFGMVKLGKLFLTMVTMAHWAACILRMLPDLEDDPDRPNWMTEKFNNDGVSVRLSSLSVQYTTAVYWSSMTLSTVGYGDISLLTDAERLFATITMFIGGGVFAYVVGSICTIMTEFGELNSNFEQRLDQLNKFMTAHHLAQDQRVKLRSYFRYCKHFAAYDRRKGLFQLMSPQLRARTTVVVYGAAVDKLLCSLMPPRPTTDMRTAQRGIIVEANVDGTFNVEMQQQPHDRMGLSKEMTAVESNVSASNIVMQGEAAAESNQEHGKNDHAVITIGAQVLVLCPYHNGTVVAINYDGTLAVCFTQKTEAGRRIMNLRVPLQHVRDLASLGSVQVGMQLEAKSEIPTDEFAGFTAGIAAAILPRAFTPKEIIVAKDTKAEGMYLVNKGIVASHGSLFTKGEFCCQEGIVFEGVTTREYLSVSYVTLDCVAKESVDAMLATRQFPAIDSWIRRLKVRLAFKHGVRGVDAGSKRATSLV
jgi:hypothetical protein